MPETRVSLSIQMNDGLSIGVNQKMEYFRVVIGGYYVELQGGNLVVRANNSTAQLLTVPADDASRATVSCVRCLPRSRFSSRASRQDLSVLGVMGGDDVADNLVPANSGQSYAQQRCAVRNPQRARRPARPRGSIDRRAKPSPARWSCTGKLGEGGIGRLFGV